MTPQTALELDFADGAYLFDLKLPQLAELQEKCGVGILAVYARVLKGRYIIGETTFGAPNEGEAHFQDMFETIRLALIGGGRGLVDGNEVAVSALTAKSLVERYVHTAPLREAWTLAAAILGARFEGFTPPAAAAADKKKEPVIRKPRSTSRKSSRTAQPSEPIGAS